MNSYPGSYSNEADPIFASFHVVLLVCKSLQKTGRSVKSGRVLARITNDPRSPAPPRRAGHLQSALEGAPPPDAPFPGNARPPDGLPSGPFRACLAGSPATRCISQRKEFPGDVPAGDFAERVDDSHAHYRMADQIRPHHLRHVPVPPPLLHRQETAAVEQLP